MLLYYKVKSFINKAWLLLERNRYWLAVLVIISAGIFLRSYHFFSWNHFELDQARDAQLINNAYSNGPGELPLLGPRARGTYLRLGPIFYYFEYIAAFLFGNTPPVLALPVLFFSLLSLPLFYLLIREYFDKKISLGLLALFSCSLFFIMYSRFAWNPNALPFFSLLFLYALIKIVRSKDKQAGWWLIVLALALAISSQFHFLALIAFPLTTVVFLVYKRPKIKWRFWVGAMALILFFYIPVFINEAKTGGANTQEFIKAISGKSEGKVQVGLLKKGVIDYLEHARAYGLILMGETNESFLVADKVDFHFVSSPCQSACRINLGLGILGIIFFTLSLFNLVVYLWKNQDKEKKDFLWLIAIFSAVLFFMFWPLAPELSPRFFLLATPLPFIYLGLMLANLEKISPKFRLAAAGIIVALILSNLVNTKERFWQMAQASNQFFPTAFDSILKEKTRVTYVQERAIIEYIIEESQKNGFPIFYASDPEYQPSFKYLLEKSGVIFDGMSKTGVYREGNYFFISRTDPSGNWNIGKYINNFSIEKEKQFGTLTILVLSAREEKIIVERKKFPEKKKKSKSKAPKRYIWNEIFGVNSKGLDDLDEEEGN